MKQENLVCPSCQSDRIVTSEEAVVHFSCENCGQSGVVHIVQEGLVLVPDAKKTDGVFTTDMTNKSYEEPYDINQS